MAKKTELKERGTNEVLYPLTLLECVLNGEGKGITKADLGLGNVDNTSDANKPVSTAQATAIADAKKAGTDAQKTADEKIQMLTQAQYNALTTKNSKTLYIVK